MNNAPHNHTKATPSTEADTIESDIDAINKNIGDAVNELSIRIKRNLHLKILMQKRWFWILIIGLIICIAQCNSKRTN